MEQTDASQANRLTRDHVSAVEPTESQCPIGVVISWDITGMARHLSHAELMRVFERACVRARLPLRFSQGFNPHPRMSLPLPKAVGLESEGDLLCLQLWTSLAIDDTDGLETWKQQVLTQLQNQCPQGIQLTGIRTTEPKVKWHPLAATYVLTLAPEVNLDRLAACIESFLQTDQWPLERTIQRQTKTLDARSFVQTIQLKPPSVWVEVEIRPSGSLRVNEILALLELDREHLAAPIRRRAIQWQKGPGGRVFTSTGETECHEK